MKTTERNWSSIQDHEYSSFGYRAFYTREEWIEQAIEWSQDRCDDEEEEYRDWLNSLDDEELMVYIQEHWNIEIRETTWLKVGNECYWEDPEGLTSGVNTILEIRYDESDDIPLAEDTILLITDGWGENEVFLRECYGATDKTCPKCGHPLYVNDLCAYPYVCLKCDENFYNAEV